MKDKSDVLGAWVGVVLFLLFVYGVTQGGMWLHYSNLRDHVQHTYERALGQNEFWNELSGNQAFSNDVEGRLASDLKPFMKTTTIVVSPATPLLPSKLADVIVPDNYSGFYGQTGLCVAGSIIDTNGIMTGCADEGRLTSNFLQDFDLARSGRVQELLQHPIAPKQYPFWWWPFSEWYLDVALIYVVSSMLALLIASIALAVNEGWPTFVLDDEETGAKMTLLILNPWFSIPRMVLVRFPIHAVRLVKRPFQVYNSRHVRLMDLAKQQQAVQEKVDGLDRAGIKDEWMKAKANLDRLDAIGMPTSSVERKEWKKIRQDTADLVTELENFPDQLSDRAKVLLARQIGRDNMDLRDRPKAILAAREELDANEPA